MTARSDWCSHGDHAHCRWAGCRCECGCGERNREKRGTYSPTYSAERV